MTQADEKHVQNRIRILGLHPSCVRWVHMEIGEFTWKITLSNTNSMKQHMTTNSKYGVVRGRAGAVWCDLKQEKGDVSKTNKTKTSARIAVYKETQRMRFQ
jgi:hypothetical protein